MAGFSTRVCSKFFNQGLVENKKSKSGGKFSITIRLIRISFSIAIMITIENQKPGSARIFSRKIRLVIFELEKNFQSVFGENFYAGEAGLNLQLLSQQNRYIYRVLR